ncbi:MAG: sugar ABC transporter permease [Phycisphaerales bacterium]|nr:sugar ABC transporter permease [Phycisphaerales bacterium]
MSQPVDLTVSNRRLHAADKPRGQGGVAALFLLPNLLGFVGFLLIPLLAAFVLSLFRWDLFHPPRFVGLENFINLLGWHHDPQTDQMLMNDPRFWKYLWNTLFFLTVIPVSLLCSLLLAVLLNQKLRGRAIFRTIFYLPTICAGVGIYLLWMYLLNDQFGLINRALALVGITGPQWLGGYHWAKPALMLMMIWISMGGTGMILYLAGLQGISPELYEAAELDGAGTIQQFRHITVPMVAPTTLFLLITSLIGGFQGGFDMAFVMTRGGPDGATTTLSYYIYNHAFEWFNMGYAAAIAAVMFAVILVVTSITWKLGSSAR